MKFKRKKKFHLDTLIDENMIIRGNTTITGGVRLDGKIYGNLMVIDGEDGTLIMGENSVIKGDVFVPTAIIGAQYQVILNVMITWKYMQMLLLKVILSIIS